jgi:uncharacterized membrane protein YfcA
MRGVLEGLALVDWVLLAVAAACVGFAKTAIGGVGIVAVALFAIVLPARESTGALLPLLIAGDVVAVSAYARHGSRRTVLALLPGVVPGLLLGALFLAVVGDTVLTLFLGTVLLVLCGWQLALRLRSREPVPTRPATRTATVAAGATGGFATMTANAAGPVMTLYLVMAGLPKLQMIGTGAWFYLVVNLMKLPISAGLHLIDPESLLLDLVLVPVMLLGALTGWHVVRRMHQQQFELAALALAALSSAVLLATV